MSHPLHASHAGDRAAARGWWLPSAAAALSAALLAAAFPPADQGFLAWIATVPWMLALCRAPRPLAAAISGAVHSAVLHVIACTWMVTIMRVHAQMPLPLALATYAIGALTVLPFGVLPALALSSLSRRFGAWALLMMAPAWVIVDIARARMVMGFPWYLQGMTQVRWPAALGVADLGGVHAVSVLVLLGNALVAALVLALARPASRRQALAVAATAAALVLAAFVHGALAERHCAPAQAGALRLLLPDSGVGAEIERPDVDASARAWRAGGDVTVALVQAAIPQEVVLESRPEDDEMRARLQLQLTDLALLSGARVTVWSESGYPDTFATTWPLRALRDSLARAELAAPPGERPEAIVGGLAAAWPAPGAASRRPTLTNSAVLVDSRGPRARYDKRYLVPFGEYLPAKWFFVWFEQLTRPVGNFRAGTSLEPLHGDAAAFGAFICYEAVLPQHVREISRSGAEVLVNLTNDGWFRGTAVPEQHLRFAMVRAVESRKWLLRCANSGVSAVIAPDGRVVGRLEEGERGILLSSVAPREGGTVYLALGDAPLIALGLLASIATLAALVASRLEALPPSPRDG